jgi:hypothetical protein
MANDAYEPNALNDENLNQSTTEFDLRKFLREKALTKQQYNNNTNYFNGNLNNQNDNNDGNFYNLYDIEYRYEPITEPINIRNEVYYNGGNNRAVSFNKNNQNYRKRRFGSYNRTTGHDESSSSNTEAYSHNNNEDLNENEEYEDNGEEEDDDLSGKKLKSKIVVAKINNSSN